VIQQTKINTCNVQTHLESTVIQQTKESESLCRSRTSTSAPTPRTDVPQAHRAATTHTGDRPSHTNNNRRLDKSHKQQRHAQLIGMLQELLQSQTCTKDGRILLLGIGLLYSSLLIGTLICLREPLLSIFKPSRMAHFTSCRKHLVKN
jgi:hypothetical protein